MSGALPIGRFVQSARADLHLHSANSDGALSIPALVRRAASSGLGVFAITDHDDMSAGRDAVTRRELAALGANGPVCPSGIEITCALEAPLVEHGWQEVHIVGLGVRPGDVELRKAVTGNRLGQIARLKQCMAQLRAELGVDASVFSYRHLGRIARTRAAHAGDIATLLVRRGLAPDLETAISELVAPNLPTYRSLPHGQRFSMDVGPAIAAIHAAGGVAILAHPLMNVPDADPEVLESFLLWLKDLGLDGVEVYRHDRDPELLRSLAERTGLLLAGGSDFHRSDEWGRRRAPGDAEVPLHVWGPLEARIHSLGGVADLRELPVRSR